MPGRFNGRHQMSGRWEIRNYVVPGRSWRELGWLAAIAAAGGLIAGVYGIVHDQITYSISPEYFTRMKFAQFHIYESALPEPWLLAMIGFRASW